MPPGNCWAARSAVERTVVLLIGIGNPLRGDDGVAHHVVEFIAPAAFLSWRAVHQLTPEVADEIAGADAVFFLDADPRSTETSVEKLHTCEPIAAPFSHNLNPASVLELARRLFGFSGEAFLCHIPAKRFEHGQELSPEAQAAAKRAASIIMEQVDLIRRALASQR
jgi:hydrogenase maturation protease